MADLSHNPQVNVSPSRIPRLSVLEGQFHDLQREWTELKERPVSRGRSPSSGGGGRHAASPSPMRGAAGRDLTPKQSRMADGGNLVSRASPQQQPSTSASTAGQKSVPSAPRGPSGDGGMQSGRPVSGKKQPLQPASPLLVPEDAIRQPQQRGSGRGSIRKRWGSPGPSAVPPSPSSSRAEQQEPPSPLPQSVDAQPEDSKARMSAQHTILPMPPSGPPGASIMASRRRSSSAGSTRSNPPAAPAYLVPASGSVSISAPSADSIVSMGPPNPRPSVAYRPESAPGTSEDVPMANMASKLAALKHQVGGAG